MRYPLQSVGHFSDWTINLSIKLEGLIHNLHNITLSLFGIKHKYELYGPTSYIHNQYFTLYSWSVRLIVSLTSVNSKHLNSKIMVLRVTFFSCVIQELTDSLHAFASTLYRNLHCWSAEYHLPGKYLFTLPKTPMWK